MSYFNYLNCVTKKVSKILRQFIANFHMQRTLRNICLLLSRLIVFSNISLKQLSWLEKVWEYFQPKLLNRYIMTSLKHGSDSSTLSLMRSTLTNWKKQLLTTTPTMSLMGCNVLIWFKLENLNPQTFSS